LTVSKRDRGSASSWWIERGLDPSEWSIQTFTHKPFLHNPGSRRSFVRVTIKNLKTGEEFVSERAGSFTKSLAAQAVNELADELARMLAGRKQPRRSTRNR
jgi:hypothetical protein